MCWFGAQLLLYYSCSINLYYIYFSAGQWLITSKIKVFVYIIYVCTVYIYYVYIYKDTYSIYFENTYMYIFIQIISYINI